MNQSLGMIFTKEMESYWAINENITGATAMTMVNNNHIIIVVAVSAVVICWSKYVHEYIPPTPNKNRRIPFNDKLTAVV